MDLQSLDNKKNQTDWFSWCVHYLVGMVMGAVVAFCIIDEMKIWFEPSFQLPILVGSLLFCGGISSVYGEKFWREFLGRVTLPKSPHNSLVSYVMSLTSVVAGFVIILLTIVKYIRM